MAEKAGTVESFPLDVGDEESALRQCRGLLEAVGDGIYQLDTAGRFVAVSDGFTELTGYSREELFDEHASLVFGEEDIERAESTIRAMVESDLETATLEVTVETVDGEELPCELRLAVLRADGEFRGTAGVLTDRSADEAADRSLQRRHAALRAELDEVFERIDDAFYALDDEFRFTYVNERAEELLGHDESELLGESVFELFPEAKETGAYDAFHTALETQEPTQYELYFEPLQFRVEANVYPSETGLSVYFQDVTERRRRQRALEESEQRYRTLAEHFPNGLVMLFGDDLRYTLVAGQAFEDLPYPPDALEGKRPRDLFEEEVAEAVETAFRAALDGEQRSTEMEYLGRQWLLRTVPVADDEGDVFGGMAMAQDVTERAEIRQRLEEYTRTLQRLYEVSADRELSFDRKIQTVLDIGCEYLDIQGGLLSRVDGQEYEVRFARGDIEGFEPGDTTSLETTHCRRAIESDELLGIDDAETEGYGDDPAYEAAGIASYLGGEVRVDGETYGTLCFISETPRSEPFTEQEKRFVELTTQWVSYELERRQREQQLQQYREYTDDTLDAIDDVFYTLGEEGEVLRWNERLCEVTGYSDEEIDSMNALEFFAEADRPVIAEGIQEVFETGSARVEVPFLTKDGEKIPHEFVASALEDPEGTPVVTGVGRDISERLAREQELEQYRALTEAANDVIVTIDRRSVIQSVNPAVAEIFGYDPEELVGEELTTLMPEEYVEGHRQGIQRYLETGERNIDWNYVELPGERADGEEIPLAISFSEIEHGGQRYFTGIMRDITERRAHEEELQRRQRQQEVVATLGQLALGTDDLDELMSEVTTLVAETLDAEYCKILDLDDAGEELLLRQGTGWQEGIVGSATVKNDRNSQAGYTLLSEQPVVVEDLDAETRFSGPELLTSHDVKSGISTVIGSVDEPWGILGIHDTERRSFAEEDLAFVQSVANVVATAIDRIDRETQLEHQREQLEAINSLHEVVRSITDAVVEQPTREEIEQTVCDHLAAADSYRFAWIGDVDTPSQAILPRASAGTGGYLEEIEVSVDPDDPRSGGPSGQALMTAEVQASRQVQTDPEFEPWQEQAKEYGFRSSAAIPIVHEDTVYGVLNIYTDRPNAFTEEEREVVGQLGEIVGHAIAAVERKRALTSDEVLEVEFRIQDVFEQYGVSDDGWISFDRVVPLSDDGIALYGRTTPETMETLEALVENIPFWESVRFSGEGEDERRFEVRATGSPVLGTVADRGGIIENAFVERGDLNVTIHLPTGTDVREVIDAVREQYPNVELLARRQVERSMDDTNRMTLTLTDGLTERQRVALETAYHAGFFEWPRDSSGEEIAERLDISPATFTQHLRTAERKLFETLFEQLPTAS